MPYSCKSGTILTKSQIYLGDSKKNDGKSTNPKLAQHLKHSKGNMVEEQDDDYENLVIQNPYYEEDTMMVSKVKDNANTNPDLNDIEFVTTTGNIYYQI